MKYLKSGRALSTPALVVVTILAVLLIPLLIAAQAGILMLFRGSRK